MLNLHLRDEFKGSKLKGTTIDLSHDKAGGVLERPAADFLGVTYPSTDLLRMLESVQPEQTKPVVLLGGKGQGKSHLMAALYHCLNDRAAAKAWLDHWAATLGGPEIAKLQFREGTLVIAESLSNQRYKFLWDILFDQHPHGEIRTRKMGCAWEEQAGRAQRQIAHRAFREPARDVAAR